jgi:hypothetical protein
VLTDGHEEPTWALKGGVPGQKHTRELGVGGVVVAWYAPMRGGESLGQAPSQARLFQMRQRQC